MKRFYKTAEAGTAPGGHVLRLDGKAVKTPLGSPLLMPTAALAAAVAEEWAFQRETVNPETMPLTKLANTLVDKVKGADRAAMEGQLVEYVKSDLVCYHATHPEKLVKLHKEAWTPLLDWLKEEYGAALEAVSGIQYHQQPEADVDKMKAVLHGLSAEDFLIAQAVTATTGSVIIALAVMEGKLSAEEAYQAACVDEIYQLETWGADAQAQKRLDNIRADLESVIQFRDLLKATS